MRRRLRAGGVCDSMGRERPQPVSLLANAPGGEVRCFNERRSAVAEWV